ncbi:tail fiber protein [Nostoc sp. FACHB-973]|nr:tail fiber protein [Nostoc sp. FACHB-973]
MSRIVLNDGDVLYASVVNQIGEPIPDGQDLIGHGPKVVDAYLADDPDAIKSRFYSFYNRLRVSYLSGQTFSYSGGAVLLGSGVVVSIPSGSLVIPASSTRFIYVDNVGSVQATATLPNESFPMAFVTSAGAVTDLRDKIVDRVTPSQIPATASFQPGMGMEFYGSTLPAGGWLWMDGASYPVSTYPGLFAAIGYTHGGSGANFNVPDKRGRVGVGAGQGAGLTLRSLGQTFGAETHTLTVSEMPLHNHGVSDPGHNHGVNETAHVHGLSDPGHGHGVYDPGHSHSAYVWTSGGDDGLTDGFLKNNVAFAGEDKGPNTYRTTNVNGTTLIGLVSTGIGIYPTATGVAMSSVKTNLSLNAATTGLTISSQGGGGSHNNLQPSLVCNYIIKF